MTRFIIQHAFLRFSQDLTLFELKLLQENDPLYPPEAKEVSAATWMLLSML